MHADQFFMLSLPLETHTLTNTLSFPFPERRSVLHFLSPQPSVFLYLPHLKEQEDSLKPNIYLSQGRSEVSLVLGIPTVQRQKESYLVNTVNSLLYDLTPEQKSDIIIIIFVAETDSAFVRSVAEKIHKNFPDDVTSGLIEVISPSPYYYPNLTNLKETFGDSKERVKWRTKQNLDYSFLMLYAQHKGTYYIQMEDDIVAKSGYSESIKAYVQRVIGEQWLYLEFSQLGFIGKLFRASDLPTIVEFFLMFHKDKPIDWLLDHFLWVKVCNPEKDGKHCSDEKARLKRTFKPSLFQHVGLHSSLPGKIQKLKDKDFGKQVLYKAHSNPAALLKSSLIHYQKYSLDSAYMGKGFFWALTPVRGDYILITFTKPQTVKSYLFRSGNIETNGDKFYNTTVEVLPSDVSQVENRLLPCCRPSTDGFAVISSFVNGVAEGVIDTALHELDAMRLLVHSDSDVWVLLSENKQTETIEIHCLAKKKVTCSNISLDHLQL
uniref:Alpha-1,3-mannosyl-glycoprotein 4-beta-N-acetylglucosaminyltransferase B n=1 Tax=Electrophorus electricus TaxID=8005 RepID=A0A4W4DQZ5_ELEEL